MRCYIFGLMMLAAAMAMSPAGHAQRASQRTPFAPDRVTILTDGIADPSSIGVQLVNELAGRLGQQGMRVLPIAGEGALGNLRDLLLLKGVDLAILNNDILDYVDLTGEYPEARKRIRYVTHLSDQTVYLLARKDRGSIEALRGRKVAGIGPAGGAAITARTIFGLLKIEIDLRTIGIEQLASAAIVRDFDGIVLTSGDVLRLSTETLGDFHLLPIAPNAALRKAYKPARISPNELAGIARAAGAVDTISVSTMLAVFDWAPQQTRYGNVTTFVKGFFQSLPTFRTMPSAALWRQVDLNATAPGWVRYGPADPVKLLTAAQLASLAAVEKPAPKMSPPISATASVPASPAPAAAPTQPAARARPLSIVVINRAPLTDERAKDGGLLPALLTAGLKLAAPALTEPATIRWSKSDPLSLQQLTNESGADVLLPWDLADCERPSGLTQPQAMLCDRAAFSDPIMQVVVGLFTLADSSLKFDSDKSIDGRSICVPLDRDLTELTAPGRNWIAEKRITLVRQPTLIDCIGLVQRREADALVATDLEGWTLLRQIGIPTLFAMAERPLGTRTIHAAVWKNHPQADTMIETVNRAIRQVKDSGGHANLMRQHLMSIWDNKISVR